MASKRHVKRKQEAKRAAQNTYVVVDPSKPLVSYYCEFCGIYKSTTGPRCNKCETD